MMISKDMKLMDLLQRYPGAEEILARHGMSCIFCMGASMETIEEGARMHSLNLEALLAELNRLQEGSPA
ncbi:DUF1858 domain-containing protein [Heliophilum fasciatum]|uniref:Hybrid cluster-associated redox disulfide protein n=1 Tax=Heliophilum fasciatum TaxID=35700 RepID=A0A4R2RLD6_9FIRM|nr:DUF1858 domain-containing protein [Heliophilum fasciatum]MCW2278403.1 hybrid cluster-associated redox disulfide protein [Heliophilum fasciatum]TCP63698.1 hybrid cluster-associated redox disulfide protein [Heliophilum fasciatum]